MFIRGPLAATVYESESIICKVNASFLLLLSFCCKNRLSFGRILSLTDQQYRLKAE